MKNIIIAIHGLGNKPPVELLSEWWKKSIEEGLQRPLPAKCKFDICYWADILHPRPLDISVTDPDDELYIDEPYLPAEPSAAHQPQPTKSKIMDFVEKNLDAVFLNDDKSLNFSAISDVVIHRYFQDLDAYFAQQQVRDRIRNRLAEMIRTHAGKRILLIAHSMGSIVAYDVLTLITPDIEIDTFITIGSPLGLPVIVHRILSEQMQHAKSKKISAPENICSAWYNFSDPEDKVALDHSLSDDFAPNSRGIAAQDRLIYNTYSTGSERNPHKSFGYLRSPELSTQISTFLETEKTFRSAEYARQKIKRLRAWLKNNLTLHSSKK